MIKNTNYFEIFNLEVAFDIDISRLEEQYYILQKKYYPDFYQNQQLNNKKVNDELDDKLAMQQYLAIINDGYKILSNPLLCAIYIVKLKFAINLNDDEIRPDTAIISEIIEIEEEIINKINSKEPINDIIKNLKQEIKKLIKQAISNIDEISTIKVIIVIFSKKT